MPTIMEIIQPRVVSGCVSHRTNLGVNAYDLETNCSPGTDFWTSKVLHLVSPKYNNCKTYWFDRSRYCNHGTITGAVWKQLPSGIWVMSFDGVDDIVSITSSSSLEFTSSPFTIIAWVNVSSNVDWRRIVSKGQYEQDGYVVFSDSLGRVNLETSQSGSGQHQTSTSVVFLVPNTWQCIAVTRSGSSAQMYGNGKSLSLAVTGTHVDPAVNTGRALSLGASSVWWAGYIDNVKVLNRQLTASEIYNYYNATKWRYQ